MFKNNFFLEFLLIVVIGALIMLALWFWYHDSIHTCYNVTIVYIDGTTEQVHCNEYFKGDTRLVLDNRYILFNSIREYTVLEVNCDCELKQ